MSVNLSIKSVPEALAERLRARAERNHRSLQGELMAILERAALEGEGGPSAMGGRTDAGALPVRTDRRGTKTIEQWVAERALNPLQASPDLPRAVDIVRQARDSR